MSEIKRKVKATRRLSEATHGVTSLSLTAILTAAAADLYEQRRPKTVAGRGKRARGGLGKTGANEPGRFSPPAPIPFMKRLRPGKKGLEAFLF